MPSPGVRLGKIIVSITVLTLDYFCFQYLNYFHLWLFKAHTPSAQQTAAAVPEDDAVPGVEGEAAAQHVEEELDVLGVGEVAGHRLEHAGDQPDPVKLVHHVHPLQLLHTPDSSYVAVAWAGN